MSCRVVLSLGSNLEPRSEWLDSALRAIANFPSTRIVSSSEREITEPIDVPAEFADLKFLNQLVIAETELPVEEFSLLMHRVEDDLGRVRTVKNGPRTIDIDMIDFDGIVRNDPVLTLPHPRAMERAFVREPWKALLRAEMKRLRRAVLPEVRAEQSHALCNALLALVGDARLVCCYDALKTELDLSEFVAACRARNVEVVFPLLRECADGSNAFFVPRNHEVDLWICPGLAFTADGKRLGFGGGWYDRFLAASKPASLAIGVAYAFQIQRNLPQGLWDRRLDAVMVVDGSGCRLLRSVIHGGVDR